MSEQITNCPQCGRHCDLTMPNCERGKRFAEQITNGVTPEQAMSGGHHDHHHGGRPDDDSLAGMFRACGHRLHHGGEGAEKMFDKLTPQEQETLKGLLKKLL